MEEAEKRKERLRANRIETAQSETSSPAHLLNPLAAAPPSSERHPASIPRFDFYTDPMSAFSGGHGIPPRDNFHSPVVRGFPSPRSPFPQHHFQHQQYYSHQMAFNSPMPAPRYGPWISPPGRAPPISESSGPVAYRGIIGPPRGRFRGTGSPGSNYGRGRGSWRPGSYGRGRGSGELSSARERPELFSNRMMVVDPWVGLEPVVGRIFTPPATKKTSDSPNSWLPSSIRTKKVKVQETISGNRSQISLAQSIAMAFEETAKEEGGI